MRSYFERRWLEMWLYLVNATVCSTPGERRNNHRNNAVLVAAYTTAASALHVSVQYSRQPTEITSLASWLKGGCTKNNRDSDLVDVRRARAQAWLGKPTGSDQTQYGIRRQPTYTCCCVWYNETIRTIIHTRPRATDIGPYSPTQVSPGHQWWELKRSTQQ